MRAPGIAVLLIALFGAGSALAGEAGSTAPVPSRDEAVRLYDEGRYAEAGELLARLAEAERADGSLLYRLHYCQRVANDAAASQTLERARQKLEQEAPNSPDLEAPFYLSNAYSNLGRAADVRRVAGEATRRVETGALPEPSSALELFRLGKLYADLNREDAAARWFGAALDAFADEPGAPAYVRWAAGYVARLAFRREDYVEAARRYATLVRAGEPTMDDLDRLAVSHARLGQYEEAAAAWRQAEHVDPANADRARYCRHLAMQAHEIGDLSPAAPDGRLWVQWTRPELETVMRTQVEEARTALQEARETPDLDQAGRAAFQQRLDAARKWFVSSAMEYALQGHNIREAAFFGGYAPLVFHSREWRLPPS